jgi:hypothetical protein
MKKITLLLLVFCNLYVFATDVLTIDGVNYSVDTLAFYKVGPGTTYTSLRLQASKRLDVFFLKTDLTNPFISFKTVLGLDSIYTGEQPSAMAKRKSKEGAVYFAGTNGDFYNTTGYVGLPIGCTMIDGQIATPPNGNWKSIAFDEQNTPGIGVLTYSIKVKKGTETWIVNRVNHVRENNQLVLFNQHNGKATRTNAYGTEVLLQLADGEKWGVNKTINAKVVKIEVNKGNMAIPAGYAVLSGHGTSQTLLNTLALNDELNLEFTMLLDGIAAPFSNIVGGESRAPMLKNGIVEQSDIWNELHPRTGIGYTQDKKNVIFCVVDGRGLSAGVTTKQLAQLMQSAGAYTAFNMDGGGSSCMYVKEFGPMNTPSDGTERAVANGIFAVSSAPTDNTIAEIKAYNSTIKLPKFGVFIPKFLAYNQYGVLINKDLQGVTLSCNAQVGEIAPDGSFVASGSEGGNVTATYQNISTQFKVELVTSAQISMRLDSVLVDNNKEYPIQVQSVIGLNTMEVLPAALNWNSKDPSICSAENGIIKGLKNGKTYVVGALGDFKDSLLVTVEIPASRKIIISEFDNGDWVTDASAALNVQFNAENLPTSWSYGKAFNFVFASTRAPYIKLTRNFPLYSLPDTMKIVVNTGDIEISRLLVGMKANNSAQTLVKEFNNFQKNTDTEITLALNTFFDTKDIAIYPIWFNYMTFYLGAINIGQSYTLALKDIALYYKNVDISGTSLSETSTLKVFPNPVKNKKIKIVLNDFSGENITVKLFTLTGQCVVNEQFENAFQNEISFDTEKITSGTYVLQITSGKKQSSHKLVIL